MGRTTIVALLLLAAGTSFGQGSRGVPLRVTAVRHWSLDAVTRIAVEVSGDFEYHTERLHNPERVFFDIFRARPAFDGKRALQEGVGDKLVSKVRIAETLPGVTRVVLDLASPVVYTASTIGQPQPVGDRTAPGGGGGARAHGGIRRRAPAGAGLQGRGDAARGTRPGTAPAGGRPARFADRDSGALHENGAAAQGGRSASASPKPGPPPSATAMARIR